MSVPNTPTANALGKASDELIRAVTEFASQYAVSVGVAVFVAMVLFPGNSFQPFPWHYDDYRNLSSFLDFGPGHWLELDFPRPVSSNFAWHLGRLGEMPYFVVQFLLLSLLPVLAVRLALRLYRCRLDSWLVMWLVASVSFCTYVYEESPWYYFYTGTLSNLTSLTLGLLAAFGFSSYINGARKSSFVLASLLFLAAAFAKEDILLFVPCFVAANWCVLRLDDKQKASFRSLALVFGLMAIVVVAMCCWNTWVVPSQFIWSAKGGAKHDWTVTHLVRHSWRYMTSWHSMRVVFGALAFAVVLGLLRRGHRVAALSSLALVAALILPNVVSTKFYGYYTLNWMSVVVALSLVGIAVAWRPFVSNRFAIVPWIAPVAVVMTVVLASHSAADARRKSMTTLNQDMERNRYIVQQLLHRRAEFADAKTIAVQGVDNMYSPWYRSDGRFVNMELGRDIYWLLVFRPKSSVALRMTGHLSKTAYVEVVAEEDLSKHPGVTILKFDENLNLTVHAPGKQQSVADRTADEIPAPAQAKRPAKDSLKSEPQRTM